MRKWEIGRPDPKIARDISVNGSVSMLCGEVLASRGIPDIEAAANLLICDGLSDPFSIMDMKCAVNTINEAIDGDLSICIYGDYDCDGIMATVILYSYFLEQGINVSCYIPERDEGYGLNEAAIRRIHESGAELIITVDNGITALKEAELIYELGMKLVITDHHQPLEELPRAEAVVDPHRSDCPSSYKKYCGAALALILVAALDGGDYTIAMEQFGELAAIATVADVVELSSENRFIVQRGIYYLGNTERTGLLALMEQSGVSGKKLTSTTLAFSLAPRINAAGRFGSPMQAVKLLMAESEEEAAKLARELEECNRARKEEERKILEAVREQISRAPSLAVQRVLVFAGKNWHHGVIGIVAARLQERFGKPVFMITIEDDCARGSARAFGDFSVFACLDSAREHLTRYGGHPGAGGFSLMKESVPAFTAAVQRFAGENFPEMPVLTERAEKLLMPSDLTLENVGGLSALEPFGAGNSEPVFAMCRAIVKELVPLSGGAHTKLRLIYGGMAIETLLFRVAPEDVRLSPEDVCDLLVNIGINSFGGRKSLSIIVRDYRRSGVKQAKYFAAVSAYEKYVRGEELPSAYYKAIAPSRDEMAAVYKCLPVTEFDIDALFMRMQAVEMNYCKLRIALDVFAELGLIETDIYGGKVRRIPASGRVNLEDSAILREVREKGEA